MAKIILLFVVALLVIFPLFLSHAWKCNNSSQIRVRYNAVTSLSNIGDETFDGLGSARKLGTRQNAITSLSNTNKAT